MLGFRVDFRVWALGFGFMSSPEKSIRKQLNPNWVGIEGLGFRYVVAEWIHFTLFGIILPTLKLKVCTFGGLMNLATKDIRIECRALRLKGCQGFVFSVVSQRVHIHCHYGIRYRKTIPIMVLEA